MHSKLRFVSVEFLEETQHSHSFRGLFKYSLESSRNVYTKKNEDPKTEKIHSLSLDFGTLSPSFRCSSLNTTSVACLSTELYVLRIFFTFLSATDASAVVTRDDTSNFGKNRAALTGLVFLFRGMCVTQSWYPYIREGDRQNLIEHDHRSITLRGTRQTSHSGFVSTGWMIADEVVATS